MGVFLKAFAVYFFGMTDVFYSIYMPLHFLWLEMEWPGINASLLTEERYVQWRGGEIEVIIGFLFFYGAVHFGLRFLPSARHRLLGLFKAEPAPLIGDPL